MFKALLHKAITVVQALAWYASLLKLLVIHAILEFRDAYIFIYWFKIDR